MDKLDKLISEALEDEDREILEKIDWDPGYSEMATGLFRGNLFWENGRVLFYGIVFLCVGIYASWKFFTLSDELEILRWGIPAAALLLSALICRAALYSALLNNRVLLALKRLEMQIALLKASK